MSNRFSKNHHIIVPPTTPSKRPAERSAPSPEEPLSIATLPARPWLRDAIQANLTAGDVFHKAVAYGLVLLRWVPRLERSLSPNGIPAPPRDPGYHRLARNWCISRSEQELRTLGEQARKETDRIQTALSSVIEVPEARWWTLSIALPPLLRARDHLEAVDIALETAGSKDPPSAPEPIRSIAHEERESLQQVLRQLDALATPHTSQYLSVQEVCADNHLVAVAVQNPNAWWGAAALPDS